MKDYRVFLPAGSLITQCYHVTSRRRILYHWRKEILCLYEDRKEKEKSGKADTRQPGKWIIRPFRSDTLDREAEVCQLETRKYFHVLFRDIFAWETYGDAVRC